MKKIKLPSRPTLDFAWKYCLMQWRWLIKQLKKNPDLDINYLKRQWWGKHFIGKDHNDSCCLFCNYSLTHPVDGHDCNCPAKKVDKYFCCIFTSYQYDEFPQRFYKKLKELDRIRNGIN